MSIQPCPLTLLHVNNLKDKIMEWTFEDNKQPRQIETAEDIKTAVQEAMDETIDYFVLAPSEPIRDYAYIQASRYEGDRIHLNVCFVKSKSIHSFYSQKCSPNVAIILLQLFYTEGAVPDVSDWKFVGDFKV